MVLAVSSDVTAQPATVLPVVGVPSLTFTMQSIFFWCCGEQATVQHFSHPRLTVKSL